MSIPDAILIRHGRTKLSPRPEGWRQTPLTQTGAADAQAGANWLQQHHLDLPQPDSIITSDLLRSTQTAGIAGRVLGIGQVTTRRELRAYDPTRETPRQYERRSEQALQRILADPDTPLVVGHRSFSSWLGQKFGVSTVEDRDYSRALIGEGGLLAIGQDRLTPLYRAIPENWPSQVNRADDEPDGPDDDDAEDWPNDDDDHPRALRSGVPPVGTLERRSGVRRDLTPHRRDASWRFIRPVRSRL